jgi:hypothetical protein
MGRAKRYIITIADDDRRPLDKLCQRLMAPTPPVTCCATARRIMTELLALRAGEPQGRA